MPRRFSVFSLFSGCGGLDLGFEATDFELVYACDSDLAAVDCYQRNIAGHIRHCSVESEEFREDLKTARKVDVVLGGFPCQGFSKAGPKDEGDERNQLYQEMKNAVSHLKPGVFVAENVDGLSQNFGGIFLKRIVSEFSDLGYTVDVKIIQAADFGVPQFRRRIIFVGVNNSISDEFEWPVPSHAVKERNGEFKVSNQPTLWDVGRSRPKLNPPASIQSAIGDLLDLNDSVPDHVVTNEWPEKYEAMFARIGPGQKLCNVRHSPTSVYTWMIPEVFGDVSDREKTILETIAMNRRHKKYGSIPNGNPLSRSIISDLSGLDIRESELKSLEKRGYLKAIDIRYDLKGAMFCSGLFKRPNWNEPSPTVLTNFHNPRYFIHPIANRPFSLRECARLQTFPDDFLICGPQVDLVAGYRLIGNAVPPAISKVIAEGVYKLLAGKKSRRRKGNETTLSTPIVS